MRHSVIPLSHYVTELLMLNYLTTTETAELLEVPSRTLIRWVTEGLLRPQRIEQGPKRWIALWSERDMREAQLALSLLRDVRLPLEQVRTLMEAARNAPTLEGGIYLQLLAPLGKEEWVPRLRLLTTDHPEQLQLL